MHQSNREKWDGEAEGQRQMEDRGSGRRRGIRQKEHINANRVTKRRKKSTADTS